MKVNASARLENERLNNEKSFQSINSDLYLRNIIYGYVAEYYVHEKAPGRYSCRSAPSGKLNFMFDRNKYATLG